jgi:hypothetical protein
LQTEHHTPKKQQHKEDLMKRRIAVLVAGIAAVAIVTTTAVAVVPGETPFPSAKVVTLFVAANTFTGTGSPAGEDVMTSRFLPGATVVFKVFAADATSKQVLTAGDVRYAYIKIPNQPNVKLTYVAPTRANGPNFTGTWTVPATYPLGVVNFVARFQSKSKKYGNFVQIPVDTSQLTIVR